MCSLCFFFFHWCFKSLYYPWRRWCNNANLILWKMNIKLCCCLWKCLTNLSLFSLRSFQFIEIVHNAQSKTDSTRERKKIKQKKKRFSVVRRKIWALWIVSLNLQGSTWHSYHTCACADIGNTAIVMINSFCLLTGY